MILGLGSDLTDIRRIERGMARFGARFVTRIFTENERQRAEALAVALRPAFYAKRFAAKEACAKALGTGFAKGVTWRDFDTMNGTAGRPVLHVTGVAARRLMDLTPAGMAARIHVTLSDAYPFALAVVILAAVPSSETLTILKKAIDSIPETCY
ncbi:MAG: holo-acyl-carrier protein synthase [Rhodospirillaceae bacterium]|nr:MAG: holo-acyl-carrier protein synthase [Rhodospirillaceae bacterium]